MPPPLPADRVAVVSALPVTPPAPAPPPAPLASVSLFVPDSRSLQATTQCLAHAAVAAGANAGFRKVFHA